MLISHIVGLSSSSSTAFLPPFKYIRLSFCVYSGLNDKVTLQSCDVGLSINFNNLSTTGITNTVVSYNKDSLTKYLAKWVTCKCSINFLCHSSYQDGYFLLRSGSDQSIRWNTEYLELKKLKTVQKQNGSMIFSLSLHRGTS